MKVQEHGDVERRVRKAEDECLKLANSEQIGEVLKAAVRPVMRSEFDKLTIKDGGGYLQCVP